MGPFTFIWEWVAQDALVYLLAAAVVSYIAKHEKQAASILMEFASFVFLYAAVFENFAVQMGWYGYGRSVLMIFHVPASVPVMEFLVVYGALKLGEALSLRGWARVVLTAGFGILTDLSLDPLAVSQRHQTMEGVIGRWTWFPAATDIQVFGIPVYNYGGWFILCGYAAIFFLLGRAWHRRSGYKSWVGMAYPPLAMLCALLLLMSPLSSALLWLGPVFAKGGASEAVMLALMLMSLVLAMPRRRGLLNAREYWPGWLTFVAMHAVNLAFALIGGHYSILAQTAPAAAIHCLILWWLFGHKRRSEA